MGPRLHSPGLSVQSLGGCCDKALCAFNDDPAGPCWWFLRSNSLGVQRNKSERADKSCVIELIEVQRGVAGLRPRQNQTADWLNSWQSERLVDPKSSPNPVSDNFLIQTGVMPYSSSQIVKIWCPPFWVCAYI